MANIAGHTGVVLMTGATTLDANISSWTLEDTAQLHDVTFMKTTTVAREFFLGLQTWTLTAEFFAETSMNLGAHSPGDTVAVVKLDVLGAATDADRYVFAGMVETMTITRDVDSAVRGTLRTRGNKLTGIDTRPT